VDEAHENECTNRLHESFDRVVSPHIVGLYRLARRVLGTDDLAWDAVQDVLVKLWESGMTPPDDRGYWLRRAVWNKSLDLLRRVRRQKDRAESSDETIESIGCRYDPSHRLRLEEMRRKVSKAIAALPGDFRDALSMYALDELDYEEIARELRVPAGTVRSRIHRARTILRREFERDRDRDG